MYRQTPEYKAYQTAYQQRPKRISYRKAHSQSPETKAYQKAYRETPKAKAAAKTLRQAPKAQAAIRAYRQTPEYKACRRACDQTPKRKAAMRAFQQTPEQKAYQKTYQQIRLQADPAFRFKNVIRSLIYTSFKRRRIKKGSRTEQILGCSFKIAMKSIGWFPGCEVHHIVPLRAAQTENDIVRLNHYTNLIALTTEEHYALHSNQFELIPQKPLDAA